MKKILLLLLLATFSIQAQTLQNPTYGNVKLKNNVTDNSATKVNVQSTDGTINTISKSDLVNVVEVNDVPSLPLVGEVGKIYVVKNVNKIYRWNGTFYQELAVTDISGKEDIANKQNSLAVDGTNTKYPTVTAVNTGLAIKQNTLNWKTPQDYGAIGNGIADDSDAIIACMTAENNILFYGSYKISKDLQIKEGQYIYSNNATITRTTTTEVVTNNAILVSAFVSNWSVYGKLTLVGSGKASGTAKGLYIAGGENYKVDGLTVKNIAGNGIEFSATSSNRGNRGLLSNISLQSNWIGALWNIGAEYNTIRAINAGGNNIGLMILGGNNTIQGGSITDNDNGIYIGGTLGNNNSHGILQGLNINHNLGYDLKAENVEYGQTIDGCHFYGTTSNGGVVIVNSYGLSFVNCILDGNLTNSDSNTPKGFHILNNCQLEPSFAFSGNSILFKDCFSKNGTLSNLNNYDAQGLNQNIGAGYSVFGNQFIKTVDTYGVNKGGSLALGGMFGSNADNIGAFAKIHGKKENANNGDIDGKLVFETSNNTTAPYSKEVGSFSSTGVFKVNNLAGTGPAQVLTDELGNLSRSVGYKVYTALLSQTGTNAPVATVLENTLGGTVVWSRTSIGEYLGTLSGVFINNKTAIITSFALGNNGKSDSIRFSDNAVRIITYLGALPTDNLLVGTLEIRVYN